MVADAFSDFSHVFLVPDEGAAGIVALHDRLYTGILDPHLRHDIPFIPHIGVASSTDTEKLDRLAGELGRERLPIAGTVSKVDIVAVAEHRVETIEQIMLASK